MSLHAHLFIFICPFTLVHIQGVHALKKRRLAALLPPLPPQQDHNCISSFSLEGRIIISQQEVGDGAISHVYVGTFDGVTVAVKQLKLYIPRLASALIQAYEQLFKLKHDNIVQVFGICPTSGYIVMEYCHTILHNHTFRTLGDLSTHYGDDLPAEHRIMAFSDIAEGLQYLHLVHGDIQPHNVQCTGGRIRTGVFF